MYTPGSCPATATVGLWTVTKGLESITHSLFLAKPPQLLQEIKPVPSSSQPSFCYLPACFICFMILLVFVPLTSQKQAVGIVLVYRWHVSIYTKSAEAPLFMFSILLTCQRNWQAFVLVEPDKTETRKRIYFKSSGSF